MYSMYYIVVFFVCENFWSRGFLIPGIPGIVPLGPSHDSVQISSRKSLNSPTATHFVIENMIIGIRCIISITYGLA